MVKIPQPDSLSQDLPHTKTPWYRHLYAQVLIAIIAGILVGYLFPEFGTSLKPLGDGFIKLVKMIIAPVIFLTVVLGIAGARDGGQLGSIVAKSMGYFLVVSTFALVLGLIVANLVHPGGGFNIDPATLEASSVEQYTSAAQHHTIVGFIMNIIPQTMVSAMTGGEILQVLFVAVITGIGTVLAGKTADPFLHILGSANTVIFKVVDMLMRLAPIGAFGAMAFTIGEFGIESIGNLGGLIATFYLTSIFFVVVVLGAIAKISGFSIFKVIRYIADELWLVLGTSSSEAALPNLMEKLEAAGIRKDIVGVVVPTGYSFNLDGTNIYMTLAALFIAQAVGIELSFGEQLLLVFTAMISSKGAAGVTGAGFVILAATLSVIPSLPVAGMALILGIDRFMSECRALTNIMGNTVATIVVAGWEKGIDKTRFNAVMNGEIRPDLNALHTNNVEPSELEKI